MNTIKITLAAALAAVWLAAPIMVRADDDYDRPGMGQGGLEGRGPRGGERMGMGGMMGQGEHDMAMHEKYMKVRDLQKKVREAVHKMRKGSDTEKASLKDEAKKLLGDLLDAKTAADDYKLAKMEKHAAELKEKIAKRKANRDKMIESRLSHLSGDGDDWE